MPLDEKNTSAIMPDLFLAIRKTKDGDADINKKLATKINIDFGTADKVDLKELQQKMSDSIDKSYDSFVKKRDFDGDGKFTLQDLDKTLPKVDILSKDEFKQLALQRIEQVKVLDKNGDGAISRDEIPKPTELPKPQKQFDPNQLG